MLKPDDWLASGVEIDALADPRTSVATAIEVQYVMEGEWDRERLTSAHEEITDAGITFVDLTPEVMDAAAAFRREYEQVNVFDSIHLGTAATLDAPIVSTDHLYPDISGIVHRDPRTLDPDAGGGG